LRKCNKLTCLGFFSENTMSKLVIISGCLASILIVCFVAFAYSQLATPSEKEQSSLPTASPTPTSTPTPNVTPASTPKPSPTSTPQPTPTVSPTINVFYSEPLDITNVAAFEGPLGSFWITSPTQQSYNNPVSLYVSGQTITGTNTRLSLWYSVDGQERVALSAYAQNGDNPFIGRFAAAVVLPTLASGSHTVTVYGRLETPDWHLAEMTVNFTIQ
jgi:hypothetical protein